MNKKILLNTGILRTAADKSLGKKIWSEAKDDIFSALDNNDTIIISFPQELRRASTAFFNGFFEALVEEEKKFKVSDINKHFELDSDHPGFERINKTYQQYLEANV